MLSRARLQVEKIRPDPARPGLARGAHDLRELLGPVGEPGQDRRHRHRDVDARRGETPDHLQPLRGGAVPGSVVRQTSSSRVGIERLTETGARGAALLQHVDVTPRPSARA